MKIDLAVRRGETLHVFQKPTGEADASRITLTTANGSTTVLTGPRSDDFTRSQAADLDEGPATIAFDPAETAVSLVYAFDPARVLDEGIRTLFTTERNRQVSPRYRLHLAPPFGWMNDPNGLSEVGGRMHLFYQHYPHSLRWNTMHWGHAASTNGIDWADQPIFLLPRAEMLASDAKTGGVFSGSAVPQADGALRVFYTDREDDRTPNWEWQMTAVSTDLLAPGEAMPVVTETPDLPGYRKDFRDPYVFKGPDGRWKMLLGGGDDQAALVLLYESDSADGAGGWRFAGVLHSEPTTQKLPAECPCMVALDGEGEGLFVLIFGMLGSRDEVSRRRNMTIALTGRFDGARFTPIRRDELDHGTDCYAFQGIVGADGPFGISWAANWTDVFKEHDFPSCMTFPRRLVWSEGALSTPPIEAVAELRLPQPPRTIPADASPLPLVDGLAEVEIELGEPGVPFRLVFDHPSFGVALDYDGDKLELDFVPPGKRPSPRYFIEDVRPTTLRLFIDVGLIEIFVDNGRFCFTKRIDSDEPISAIRLDAPLAAATARLHDLRPRR